MAGLAKHYVSHLKLRWQAICEFKDEEKLLTEAQFAYTKVHALQWAIQADQSTSVICSQSLKDPLLTKRLIALKNMYGDFDKFTSANQPMNSIAEECNVIINQVVVLAEQRLRNL